MEHYSCLQIIQQEERAVLEYSGIRDVHENEMMEHRAPWQSQAQSVSTATVHTAAMAGSVQHPSEHYGSQAWEYYTLRLTSACNWFKAHSAIMM